MLEAEPPTRLVITFADPGDEPPGGPSVVTFLVEPHETSSASPSPTRISPTRRCISGISHGWPAVLANLKSLLETGDVLPQAPWDVANVNA